MPKQAPKLQAIIGRCGTTRARTGRFTIPVSTVTPVRKQVAPTKLPVLGAVSRSHAATTVHSNRNGKPE
jgi:hypothetical protein